ncbi:hypothetical protein [Litoribaculum gwangyangense]|uniref:Lipoprotein n=1 Tax=Litoribaculum gwangyangense TaxID=1130722 RepID=A0ABP9CA65_9FLAO
MRKRTFQISIIGFLLLISCQKEKEITIENDDFKWTINIPKNFREVSEKNWDKVKFNGIETFEKVSDQNVKKNDIENTLFAYKNGKFHTLESNYKIFDTTKNYSKSNKELNTVTYESLKKAISNTELDSLSSKQMISGMEFGTFEINFNYPNGEILTTKSFRKLFGNKRFTINILYKDETIGKELINSIVNSKFE